MIPQNNGRVNKLLRESVLFRSMPEDVLEYITAQLKARTLRPGDILFNQGDPAIEMILIQSGKIALYSPEAGSPKAGQPIRLFGPGETLGEMALIDGHPRSVSARAETETQLLSLNRQNFQEVLGKFPGASIALLCDFSERVRYTTDFITEVRGWVQRMAEGNYQIIPPMSGIQDSSLASLAEEFTRMAVLVREREDQLRREIAQLRIEIDEKKRMQEVRQITESDYYRNLKDKLRAMRDQDG
jgi:CRP-like cAMP-binding protein